MIEEVGEKIFEELGDEVKKKFTKIKRILNIVLIVYCVVCTIAIVNSVRKGTSTSAELVKVTEKLARAGELYTELEERSTELQQQLARAVIEEARARAVAADLERLAKESEHYNSSAIGNATGLEHLAADDRAIIEESLRLFGETGTAE